MAKLTAAARNALPDSAFAGPGRTYPVNDASHAANAKGRATQNASPALKARVDAKANKVLKRTTKGGAPNSATSHKGGAIKVHPSRARGGAHLIKGHNPGGATKGYTDGGTAVGQTGAGRTASPSNPGMPRGGLPATPSTGTRKGVTPKGISNSGSMSGMGRAAAKSGY